MTAARKLPEPTMLALDKIRLDGGTQSRAELSEETIAEYAECVAELPPIDVFDDGEALWLADGFHRHAAFVRAGRKKILCVLHEGDVHEARRFAAGCNRVHGNRRNRDDVRAAILMLVRDDKWKEKSDNWVATTVGCSPHTVIATRKDFAIAKSPVRETSTGRKIRTTNIGKRNPKSAPKSSPRATSKDTVTADDVAAARARAEELDARAAAAKAAAAEKWECPDCHTIWPADVDICRECSPEHDGEEIEEDETPPSEERAQDDAEAGEETGSDFNGGVVSMSVYSFVCDKLKGWPPGETLEPLLEVLGQLRRKIEKLEEARS